MRNKPWKIYRWGTDKKTAWISLDNRKQSDEANKLNETTPLFTMQVSDRWAAEELEAYAVKIRDALNAAGIVEGTIEDPDQPK